MASPARSGSRASVRGGQQHARPHPNAEIYTDEETDDDEGWETNSTSSGDSMVSDDDWDTTDWDRAQIYTGMMTLLKVRRC